MLWQQEAEFRMPTDTVPKPVKAKGVRMIRQRRERSEESAAMNRYDFDTDIMPAAFRWVNKSASVDVFSLPTSQHDTVDWIYNARSYGETVCVEWKHNFNVFKLVFQDILTVK